MADYYIGQVFEEMYPSEASEWCNENNAYIEETTTGEVRTFEIKEVPEHIPTWEEIDKARERYRAGHIDTRTNARTRKLANGTWTEKDEQDYLALDAEVTAWIEENLPYPEE